MLPFFKTHGQVLVKPGNQRIKKEMFVGFKMKRSSSFMNFSLISNFDRFM